MSDNKITNISRDALGMVDLMFVMEALKVEMRKLLRAGMEQVHERIVQVASDRRNTQPPHSNGQPGLLLASPKICQRVKHDGFTKKYSFALNQRPTTLVPLTPKQVDEEQVRLQKE
ncbi:Hypothetical predicted protein, partial [Olea europaea subsp. europaea]